MSRLARMREMELKADQDTIITDNGIRVLGVGTYIPHKQLIIKVSGDGQDIINQTYYAKIHRNDVVHTLKLIYSPILVSIDQESTTYDYLDLEKHKLYIYNGKILYFVETVTGIQYTDKIKSIYKHIEKESSLAFYGIEHDLYLDEKLNLYKLVEVNMPYTVGDFICSYNNIGIVRAIKNNTITLMDLRNDSIKEIKKSDVGVRWVYKRIRSKYPIGELFASKGIVAQHIFSYKYFHYAYLLSAKFRLVGKPYFEESARVGITIDLAITKDPIFKLIFYKESMKHKWLHYDSQPLILDNINNILEKYNTAKALEKETAGIYKAIKFLYETNDDIL